MRGAVWWGLVAGDTHTWSVVCVVSSGKAIPESVVVIWPENSDDKPPWEGDRRLGGVDCCGAQDCGWCTFFLQNKLFSKCILLFTLHAKIGGIQKWKLDVGRVPSHSLHTLFPKTHNSVKQVSQVLNS